MNKFLQELQRRNVIKASISYAVIGWAILQVADILFPAFNIPDTTIRYILYVLIGGFPLWVIFAYVYEWTPTGFQKTNEVAPETSVYQKTGKRLNVFIIGGLVVAVLLLVADRFLNFSGTMALEPDRAKSIAVLPFKNMSSEEDAYFAAGVTEDILTHISKIGDLRVLSRFTLSEYDTQGKTIEEIGDELGVGFLLTGSIRRAGDDLRISCQLVQVNPEEETWAENFDKRMEDVFAIQNEVATEVARYLKAQLSSGEVERIAQAPTKNLVAYNTYLKGRQAYYQYEPEAMKTSIDLFKEAIRLDPDFALAWAGLADAYAQGVLGFGFLGQEYLDSAQIVGEKAITLNPQSEEAWKALGLVYQNKGQYDEALEKYEKALTLNPNHGPSIGNIANIYGAKGRLDEAVRLNKKQISIEPLSSRAWANLGSTYRGIEMDKEASLALNKALALQSKDMAAHYYTAVLATLTDNHKQARKHLASMQAVDPNNPQINDLAAEVAIYFDAALARDYLQKAVKAPAFDPNIQYGAPSCIGYLLWQEGKQDSARSWLDPSLTYMTEQVENGNDDLFILFGISINHCIQGNKQEAIRWFRKLLDKGEIYPSREYLLDPRLSAIHEEPEFLAMMEELNLKIAQMRMNVQAQEQLEKGER